MTIDVMPANPCSFSQHNSVSYPKDDPISTGFGGLGEEVWASEGLNLKTCFPTSQSWSFRQPPPPTSCNVTKVVYRGGKSIQHKKKKSWCSSRRITISRLILSHRGPSNQLFSKSKHVSIFPDLPTQLCEEKIVKAIVYWQKPFWTSKNPTVWPFYKVWVLKWS